MFLQLNTYKIKMFSKNFLIHYSYDIHGNVETLWQDNLQLATDYAALEHQRFKKLDYFYDLISGNVNLVSYQSDSIDAFHHKCEYDADNRIKEVSTNRHSGMLSVAETWSKDAKYFYYNHGPLARVELGHNKVQGIDYAYTLQGWLKGVNSETLDSIRDIGRDGNPLSSLNSNFPKDVFGYSLNYFNGDYSSISNSNFLADKSISSYLSTDAPDLYNGNISNMVTTLTDIDPLSPTYKKPLPQLTAYKYDQLNRLLQMKAYTDINLTTNTWGDGGTYAGRYFNSFSYDGNGNIMTAIAHNAAGDIIDNQTYNYQTISGFKKNNRLYSIEDNALITSGNDLLDQIDFDNTETTINSANNYSYNEIGELKANKQDSIIDIKWTISGKIKEVTRFVGCHKYNLKFEYDPMGKRIAKHVFDNNDDKLYSEYYVRDAQGNTMSVYKLSLDENEQLASFSQKEMHIYGSSTIGIYKPDTELISAVSQNNIFSNYLGKKHFTGSNHLGNTLAVFSDIKIQQDYNSDNEVDCYTADISAVNDYAPFGGLLTERTFNKGSFPNTFNGKRDDPELGDWQDYGMRMYSPWARRFPSVDPLFAKYPYYTPYQFTGNNPIWAIDIDGLEEWIITRRPMNGRMKTSFFYNPNNVGEGVQYNFLSANGQIYYSIRYNDFIQGTSDRINATGKFKYYETRDDYFKNRNMKFGPLGENGQIFAQGKYWINNGGQKQIEYAIIKNIPNLVEYYETNKSDIATQAINSFKVAEFLIENPGLKVIISGYTDRQGPENYNKQLGLERANKIKEAIINSAITSNKYSEEQIKGLKNSILIQSIGEDEAAASGDVDESDNPLFRKTEIKIIE